MGELIDQYGQLQPERKILGFVGILLVLGALYYWFYYSDLDKQYKSLANRQKIAVSNFTKKFSEANNVDNLNKYVESLNSKLSTAVTLFPESDDVSRLLRDISMLAKENQVEMTKFQPLEQSVKDFFVEVPLEISFRGSYHDMATFIQGISKLQRIVNVFSLEFSNPVRSLSTNQIILDGKVLAKAYHSGVAKVLEQQKSLKAKKKRK